MAKNIIICSDGTGNTAIKSRGTNIFKLFESVDLHQDKKQLAIYDDGVGTENLKIFRILGGAFGFGLARNVRQLYTELVRLYEPGDQIYLFGFSRGAFTVRTLAGMICKLGILDHDRCPSNGDLDARVRQAYLEHRRSQRAPLEIALGFVFAWLIPLYYKLTFRKYYRSEGVDAFRRNHAVQHPQYNPDGEARIRFIGVWDTVAAVGFPLWGVATFVNRFIYHYMFPDTKLHPNVQQACHALSIDDQRKTFHPLMWDVRTDSNKQRIEQVWFAGVHANVGGGYPKQGMSLVTLVWMLDRAHGAGVEFIPQTIEVFAKAQNVHDKLYDSRAGVYAYYRYAPRDIYRICRDNGIEPQIHASAINRIRYGTEGYAPGNLPRNFDMVNGGIIRCEWPQASEAMSHKLKDKTSLLETVSGLITFRKAVYWGFFIASLIAIHNAIPQDLKNQGILAVFKALFSGDLVSTIFANLLTQPWILLLAIAVFYLLGLVSRSLMRNSFSEFWHQLVHGKPTGT